MLRDAIETLIMKKNLTTSEITTVCEEILENKNSLQTAAFLALLRAKGESAEDIVAMATVLRAQSRPFEIPFPCIDIVGTGGDGSQSVNISTGAAILTAACGVPVAKHGNRANTSKCGSADVLEALGVSIDLSPKHLLECLKQLQIAFFFAPSFNPMMKSIASLRKELGIPSIFNILGPLLHPARVPYAMIGVGRSELVPLMAEAVSKLGFKRALVFGGNGFDELTCVGSSNALLLSEGKIENFVIDPEKLGFSLCKPEDLRGGLPAENADLLHNCFEGRASAISETLILNAGIALFVYGATSTPKEGCERARMALQNGSAMHLLKKFVELSQSEHPQLPVILSEVEGSPA